MVTREHLHTRFAGIATANAAAACDSQRAACMFILRGLPEGMLCRCHARRCCCISLLYQVTYRVLQQHKEQHMQQQQTMHLVWASLHLRTEVPATPQQCLMQAPKLFADSP